MMRVPVPLERAFANCAVHYGTNWRLCHWNKGEKTDSHNIRYGTKAYVSHDVINCIEYTARQHN
jgi:hypothetical protein